MRRPESRDRLAEQLHVAGLPKRGMPRAVEDLAEVIAEFDAVAFTRKPVVESLSDGRITIDIPRRLFLTALILECAIIDYLDNGDSIYRNMHEIDSTVPRWHCPMASMDFLVVTLAWMFERDRDMNCCNLFAKQSTDFVELLPLPRVHLREFRRLGGRV